MEGKIEVGDVFTHDGADGAEYTCKGRSGAYVVYAGDNPRGIGFHEDFCRLVRKADPYHGITLPQPPAGYRLAKWGEEFDKRALWWDAGESVRDGLWREYGDGTHFTVNEWPEKAGSFAWNSIFAIPLDQPSPLKSWQFREVPWVQLGPRTLADVPDGTDCIAAPRCKTNLASVVCRRGDTVLFRNGDWSGRVSSWLPVEWAFVRYLDPPPPKPLSLDDVPDGRVIQCRDLFAWKSKEVGEWLVLRGDGTIRGFDPSKSEFTVTNYIAEFK